MTIRKIDAMHHYYGFGVGRCEDCPHFIRHGWDKMYYKCLVYGISNAESTDWRKSWQACGLIDKPFPGGDTRVVDRITAAREEEKPIDGQLDMFGGEYADNPVV